MRLKLTIPTWKRGKIVLARWQIAERQPPYGTIKKLLNVELKDLDGCPTNSSQITEEFYLRDGASNRMILTDRKPNSLYKVTLSVAYDGGEVFNSSEEIRTLDIGKGFSHSYNNFCGNV